MSYWLVKYQAEEQSIKAKLLIFEQFWKKVGPKYCTDKKIEYIEKYLPPSVNTA